MLTRAFLHCTCHAPSSTEPMRMILRDTPDGPWLHEDDRTFAETAHVHGERDAADCDGPVTSTYVVHPVAGEVPIVMWIEHVENMISVIGNGTLTLECEGDDRLATWTSTTDEGYSNATARYCVDPSCAYRQSSRFDAFAAAMGY